MSVDWSEAPEGATHWDSAELGFMRPSLTVGDWDYFAVGDKWTLYGRINNQIRSDMVTRPVTWDGEGLPPVGTVCEISLKSSIDKHAVDIERYKSHAGKKVEIVAHHDIGGGCRAAVYAYSNDFAFEYHSLIEGHFRPIRTAEQIEADEREEAAIELAYVATGHRDRSKDCWISLAKVIYDAGYRKQPAL